MEFKAVRRFWLSFKALSADQKQSAQYAFSIFKNDIHDYRLRTHRIHKLSGIAKHTIWSAEIEGNLRIIFRVDGNVVTTLDIGTHDVYE